jgi:hypothetical protein
VVSDARIKTDIVDADLERCYEIVKAVPLKHFGFRPGVYTDEQIQDKHSLGWIAQDVQQVFARAVSVKPFTMHTPQPDGTVQDEVIEDCLDLNSGQMIAALYGCVQALMAKVEALEARYVDDRERLLEERHTARHTAVIAAIDSLVTRFDTLNGRTREAERNIAVLNDRSNRTNAVAISALSAVVVAGIYWVMK